MKTSSHYLCHAYQELDDTTAVRQIDRETFLLICGDQQYQLKTHRRGRTVQAVQERLEYLEEAGFSDFVPILPNTDGEPVIQKDGFHLFLQPHYPVAALDDPHEVQRLARTIASLHRCTTDEDGRTIVHGALCSEAVRLGPEGELLLDLWEQSYRGNAVGDLVDLILMIADDDPRTAVSIIRAYHSANPLEEYQLQRLSRRLNFHGIDVSRHPAIDTTVEDERESPEAESDRHRDRDELLVRARRAAEEGRWNVTHDRASNNTCGDRDGQGTGEDASTDAPPDIIQPEAPDADSEEPTPSEIEVNVEAEEAEEETPAETSVGPQDADKDAPAKVEAADMHEEQETRAGEIGETEDDPGEKAEAQAKEPLYWTFPPAITGEPDEEDAPESERG